MATKRKSKAKPRPEPEMLTIYADILQETEATAEHEGSILINCGDAKGVWLPISQIEFSGERGDTDVPIQIPDWLADEKGLVDGQNDPDFREVADASPDDAQESPAVPAGEVVAAVMKSLDPPTQPETFTFKADVEHVYEEKYVLLLTNEQGGTASLEFDKDAVTFDGEEINVDLEEGYKGIEFTVSWELAVEKHLPEFLGVTPVPVVEPAGADASAEDAESDPEEGSQARPYRHKLRTERVTTNIELSDAEKIAYGKDLVEHLENEADYKETASSYSSRARNERKQADKVIDILKAGREERNITCDVVADYNKNQLVYVESEYPYREIQRRPMTEKDRQLTLFDTNTPPAAPQTETEAPADAPEEVPAEPDTVTLTGELLENFDEGEIIFLHQYGAGEEDEIAIPRDVITSMSFDEESDLPDTVTITRAYALESGIIEEPEEEPGDDTPAAANADGEPEGEPERSCGTCAHIHAAPEGEEPSPCTECGQDPDLPNWTDEYHVPADVQEPQPAAMQ